MENQSPTETHAEAILRAAGSSLRNYSMYGTREAILAAVQAAMDDSKATYALACIANPDWSNMTAEDARELAQKTLEQQP